METPAPAKTTSWLSFKALSSDFGKSTPDIFIGWLVGHSGSYSIFTWSSSLRSISACRTSASRAWSLSESTVAKSPRIGSILPRTAISAGLWFPPYSSSHKAQSPSTSRSPSGESGSCLTSIRYWIRRWLGFAPVIRWRLRLRLCLPSRWHFGPFSCRFGQQEGAGVKDYVIRWGSPDARPWRRFPAPSLRSPARSRRPPRIPQSSAAGPCPGPTVASKTHSGSSGAGCSAARHRFLGGPEASSCLCIQLLPTR